MSALDGDGAEFSDHEVNADAPHEEEHSLKGDLLRALGRLCFEAQPMAYVHPEERRMLLAKLLPQQYLPGPNDYTMERMVGHQLGIEHLTAAEARGRTTPSKHRLNDGMVWRHVQICVPPPACRVPLPDDASAALKAQREDWLLLESVLNPPHDKDVTWTHAVVKRWVEEAAQAAGQGKGKKRAAGMIAYPPIVVMAEIPTHDRPGKLRCAINDIFSDDIAATISDSRTLIITGVHNPPGGAKLPEGTSRSDDIPRGPWTRSFPQAFPLDTSTPPELTEYQGLACIEVVAPQLVQQSRTLKRKHSGAMSLGTWLVQKQTETQ